jgi:hypothetical protein
MAMIYQAREIAYPGGRGSGRWRVVGLSDENSGALHKCCHCESGHGSAKEADECPEAKAVLDKLFNRDRAVLERNVARKKQELADAEQALADYRA